MYNIEITRDVLIDLLNSNPTQSCPFCETMYTENCEYVYIDLGHYEQVTPNYCENLECNAYQLGCYKFDPETMVYCHGWAKQKQIGDEEIYPLKPELYNDLELLGE